MSIEYKGKVYRNLQEQVEKNKEDIEAITKDKTVTIYNYILCNDTDPHIHTQFSGTITLIGNVVISVIGLVIPEGTATYPVVEFGQINAQNVIRITGYDNQLIDIDINDFDAANHYILY